MIGDDRRFDPTRTTVRDRRVVIPRSAPDAVELDVEGHRPGDTVQGQLAVERVLAVTRGPDAGGAERHQRV
jgi:hypothetical protein